MVEKKPPTCAGSLPAGRSKRPLGFPGHVKQIVRLTITRLQRKLPNRDTLPCQDVGFISRLDNPARVGQLPINVLACTCLWRVCDRPHGTVFVAPTPPPQGLRVLKPPALRRAFDRFCLRRSTLTRQGTPVAVVASQRVARPDRSTLTIQAELINHMSNLPKHYFQDIPAELMREIMDEMQAVKPEPDVDKTLEVLDRLNRSTVAEPLPAWHESLGQFLSGVRAEHC